MSHAGARVCVPGPRGASCPPRGPDAPESFPGIGRRPRGLKAAIKRTGKEIVHLTTQRLPAGAPGKVWSPEAIFRAFCLPLHVFAKYVPAGRLDVSVRAFIGALPLPPKERAAPTISAGMTTIAESVVFFDRPTDVSTP